MAIGKTMKTEFSLIGGESNDLVLVTGATNRFTWLLLLLLAIPVQAQGFPFATDNCIAVSRAGFLLNHPKNTPAPTEAYPSVRSPSTSPQLSL